VLEFYWTWLVEYSAEEAGNSKLEFWVNLSFWRESRWASSGTLAFLGILLLLCLLTKSVNELSFWRSLAWLYDCSNRYWDWFFFTCFDKT
jgi:hypothetical protein